jgi:hypothetical protein
MLQVRSEKRREVSEELGGSGQYRGWKVGTVVGWWDRDRVRVRMGVTEAEKVGTKEEMIRNLSASTFKTKPHTSLFLHTPIVFEMVLLEGREEVDFRSQPASLSQSRIKRVRDVTTINGRKIFFLLNQSIESLQSDSLVAMIHFL